MNSSRLERLVRREVILPQKAHDLGRTALQRMAFYDQLTGMPNRHAMEAFFDERVQIGEPFGAITADLDKVKKVNDRLGHTLGDKIITFGGLMIQGQLREVGDSITARRGGDEFGGLVRLVRKNGEWIEDREEQEKALITVSDRIKEEFAETVPVKLYNAAVPSEDALGITIGSAIWMPGISLEQLMDEADTKGQKHHEDPNVEWVELAAEMNDALNHILPE